MIKQPPLIDTHVHLTDAAYNADRQEILARARRAGLVAFIDPGSDLATSQAALEFAHQNDNVFAAVGLHPHALKKEHLPKIYAELDKLAKEPAVVAIGEFGLDLKQEGADLKQQEESFKAQVELAKNNSLPIILHCRDMYDSLIKLIEQQRKNIVSGIVHSFAGNAEQAKHLVDLGFYIAFGGILTFEKRTEGVRQAAQEIPAEKMLLETDAPYLTPVPRRGKRNEPAEVATIGRFIADLRQIPYSELARVTTENAKRAFNLPEDLEVHEHY